ncbi:MAG: glycosyltransferase family 2 protein [Planctomycetia bacterium]|nr:glycosyltransferase family 2 protein [Planctomycetia bacterium]
MTNAEERPDALGAGATQQETTPLAHRRSASALLSVVLPVFNEAQVLEPLVYQVTNAAVACELEFEIVLVNDGSTDGTAEILDGLAAKSPNLRVVHLSRNFGHQAAVHAGICHASGDAIVLMDSDFQDSPGAIPAFVEKWRAGADVVYAVRASRKEPRWKRFLFAGFHRLLSKLTRGMIPVDAGNFSLVDRHVARQIAGLAERDRYLPGLRSWVGYRQEAIAVERQARYDDRSRVSLWGLFRLAKTAILSFSTFPLTVFYFIGLTALLLFLALASFSLFCKLFTDLAIPGWTSHILSASFFGALNALGISVLGEYVVRIYDQVRSRPVFLVDRTVNLRAASLGQPGRPVREIPSSAPGDESSEPVDQVLAQAEALLEAIRRQTEHLQVRAGDSALVATTTESPPRRKA